MIAPFLSTKVLQASDIDDGHTKSMRVDECGKLFAPQTFWRETLRIRAVIYNGVNGLGVLKEAASCNWHCLCASVCTSADLHRLEMEETCRLASTSFPGWQWVVQLMCSCCDLCKVQRNLPDRIAAGPRRRNSNCFLRCQEVPSCHSTPPPPQQH